MKRGFAAIIFAFAGVALAQHPNDARGFAPDRVFDVHDVDSVNGFNGNLVIRIPIGPEYKVNGQLSYRLSLTYNSHVWQYDIQGGLTAASPLPGFNAGLGWRLSMGHLFQWGDPDQTLVDAKWTYQSSDGADHAFYTDPHGGNSNTEAVYLYTRDGTYLRLTDVDSTTRRVDFADGTFHTFQQLQTQTGGWTPSTTSQKWYLTAMSDVYGNLVSISYSTTSDYPEIWTISDVARTNKVYFIDKTISSPDVNPPLTVRTLEHVDAIAFNDQPARYGFAVEAAQIPPGDGDTTGRGRVPVALLTAITPPSGNPYTMKRNGLPAYDTSISTPGVLTYLTLPTLGSIGWTYGHIFFPRQSFPRSPAIESPSAVLKRAKYDAFGNQLLDHNAGVEWTYGHKAGALATCSYSCGNFSCTSGRARQLTTWVTEPATDSAPKTTISYYSAYEVADDPGYDICGVAPEYWQHGEKGLPFTRAASRSGRFLSSEIRTAFDPSVAAAPSWDGKGQVPTDKAGSGTILRETYVKYTLDCDGASEGDTGFNHNAALSSTVTYFLDDANQGAAPCGTTPCFAGTNYFASDGYGHFRQASTIGNFPSDAGFPGHGNFRTAFTDFNPSLRTPAPAQEGPPYARCPDPPAVPSSWVLNAFTEQCVADEGGERSAVITGCTGLSNAFTAKTQFNDKGALTAKRTLAGVLGALGRTDLLATYEYDEAGNLTTETAAGGDAHNIDDQTTFPNAAPEYVIAHTLTYRNAGNQICSFPVRCALANDLAKYATENVVISDVDFDRASHLPTAARDGSGLEMSYDYDLLGRVKLVKPPAVAPTSYIYTDATASNSYSPASVLATTDASASGLGQIRQEYQYDLFGRLWRQKTLLDDDSWSIVQTDYDALGRKIAASLPEKLVGLEASFVPAHKTTFTLDSLDRPVKITAPDGTFTTFAYSGTRKTSRTAQIATGACNDQATTTEIRDALGRLLQVIEPSGTTSASSPCGTDTITMYAYDDADRLTKATTAAQVREFTYDGRGLLVSEKHPEIGVNGNGPVQYVYGTTGYDARGHALGKLSGAANGPLDLRFKYDAAERLQQVTDYGDSLRKLKTYDYFGIDDAVGQRSRLKNAVRYNRLPAIAGDIVVTETYSYDAAGRPSSRDTLVQNVVNGGAPATLQKFSQPFNYDSLGSLASLDYPTCTGCVGGDSATTIAFSRMNGYLKGVASPRAATPATSITYWPNGMQHTVTHDNGVVDTYEVNSNDGLPRPSLISFTGAKPPCPTPRLTGPGDVQVARGATAELSVTVTSGEASLSYQWFSSSGKLDGKTESKLITDPIYGTSSYWVEVASACGTTVSRTATVSLNCSGPTIAEQPFDTALPEGGTCTLAVVANGTGLSYKWFEGPVGDPDHATLRGVQALLTVDHAGTYWVAVTGGCDGNTINSNAATVTVVPASQDCPPVITKQPVSIDAANAGAEAVLAVQATGRAPITYKWHEGAPGEETTDSQFRPKPLKTTTYHVEVSNSCPEIKTTDSLPATVHITSCSLLTIKGEPNDQRVIEGHSATIAMTATLEKEADPLTRPISVAWYQGVTGDTSKAPLAISNTFAGGLSFTTPILQTDTNFWARFTFAPESSSTLCSNSTDPVVCGCLVDTRTVLVTVCHPPYIMKSPVDAITTPGAPAPVSVDARGTALTYQWFYGESGDTSNPLGMPSPAAAQTAIPITHDNTRVWVRVAGECGQANSASANLRLCYPPVITLQPPADLLILYGQTPKLSVDSDQADATYQWWEGVSGSAVPVGTGKEFTLPLLPGETTHTYFARASNWGCSTDSRLVTVTVCTQPQIVSWMTEYSTGRGVNVIIRVTASPDATAYTWYRGTTGDISHPEAGPDANASLSRAPLQTTSYWVRISNGRCTTDSPTTTVYVCTPDIVTQPANAQTIPLGTSANLSVTAAGTEPFSYQWYEGTSGDASHPLAAQTAQSVTVSPAVDKSYWVAVTSPCPTAAPARSATAQIHVCKPASITASPVSKTVCLGSSANLSVTATGTGLRYQWYVGPSGTTSQPVASSNSSTITVTPAAATMYWVQVIDDCSPNTTANSAAATLTINVPPAVTGPDDKTVVQGRTTQLSVSANQTATFEWYQGVSGNTATHVGSGATFTTPTLSQPTQYWVRANNGQCTTDSRTATMSICVPPSIGQWSGDTVSPRGATVTLRITASADATLYTLYKGTASDISNPLAGPNSNTSFNVAPLETTRYWVRVSNGTCSTDSATTTIYICTPDITAQPTASQTIVAGASATLSVTAAGTQPLSYQWYQGASGDTSHSMTGLTSSTATVSPSSNTSYWVSVASPCPTPAPARSTTAAVNVCTPATINTAPASTMVRLGSSTTLSVVASGTNLHYTWWIGPSGSTSQPIGSSDSPTITVAPWQNTSYWVRVSAMKDGSNVCGSSVDSAAAIVTVCVPPAVTGPADTIAVINQSAQLTVSANQSCTFEWYQGAAPNTAVHVGSGATFTTPPLTQATQYWVRASNGQCTTDSRTATVSICVPPGITQQPQDVTTTSGQLVSLSVVASADATTYTWYQGTAPDTSLAVVGPGNYPTIFVAPQTTTSYWVKISNGSCSSNSTTAAVRVCAPSITAQPQNASIISGASTTLPVSATGTPPLSYQWYIGAKSDIRQPINLATASSVTVHPTTNTSYWVRIFTSCGSTDSNAATVTVTPCTTVGINSTSSYYDGTAWQLSAWVTGTAVQAEWYKSDPAGSPYVRFATTANTSLVPQSSYVYVYVHAYNPCSERIQYMTLMMPSGGSAPMIASDPASATYSADTATPLRVEAHGQDLSYQWYGSDPDGSPYVPIAGQRSPELLILPRSPLASYYAVVTNGAGLVQSAAATLRRVACASPTVTREPVSVTDEASGSSVLLAVDAAGDAPLAYQWYASDPRGGSWKPVDGATSNALRVVADTAAYYYVRISNACGTADSRYVAVAPSSGCPAPSIASQPRPPSMQQQSGVALAVSAPGSGMEYQWFRSDAAMTEWLELQDGAKSSARLAPQFSPAYSYVRLRKCGKGINSAVAAVRSLSTECASPAIATLPGFVMIAPGAPVTLAIDASGEALSYQWFVSDGGTAAAPALMQDGASNTFTYTPKSEKTFVYARVTNNACGTFTDTSRYWTVISTPPCDSVAISQQPAGVTIAPGESAQLTVVASASCPLTYQWYVADPASGWMPLNGETSPVLRVAPSETEYYKVSVMATDGTTLASNTAAVKVK